MWEWVLLAKNDPMQTLLSVCRGKRTWGPASLYTQSREASVALIWINEGCPQRKYSRGSACHPLQ
jgi:hypothetical protein